MLIVHMPSIMRCDFSCADTGNDILCGCRYRLVATNHYFDNMAILDTVTFRISLSIFVYEIPIKARGSFGHDMEPWSYLIQCHDAPNVHKSTFCMDAYNYQA